MKREIWVENECVRKGDEKENGVVMQDHKNS